MTTGVMKSAKSITVMKWSMSTDNILDLQSIVIHGLIVKMDQSMTKAVQVSYRLRWHKMAKAM